jgi:hypothetical protein
LLDSSPKILACPEGDMLVSFFLENPGEEFTFDNKTRSRLINIFSSDIKLKCWGEGKSFFSGLENKKNNLEAFLMILINYRNQVKPDAEFILFKAERIIYLVRKIQKAKTDHTIRFISIIRDPRAVFTSQKRTYFPGTRMIMNNEPVKFANYWKRYIRISYSSVNKDFLNIRFEDLIADYSSNLIVLSRFIKQDLSALSPEKGNLLQRMPDVQIKIHKNIQEKLLIHKIDEWKKELTSTEIYIIERISGKLLSDAGYGNTKPNKPGISIYFYVKLQMLALHFNRFYKKINFHISRLLRISIYNI